MCVCVRETHGQREKAETFHKRKKDTIVLYAICTGRGVGIFFSGLQRSCHCEWVNVEWATQEV